MIDHDDSMKPVRTVAFLLAGVALALLLVAVPQAAVAPPVVLLGEELAVLPWGSGPGEVGLLRLPGENLGPQSLAQVVGSGELLVLDSTNRRVLRLSPGGAPLHDLPVGANAVDLMPMADGTIAVLHRDGLVVRHTTDGAVVEVQMAAIAGSPRAGLAVGALGELLLLGVDQRSQPLASRLTGSAAGSVAESLGVPLAGQRALAERQAATVGRVRLLDTAGAVTAEIAVLPAAGRLLTVSVLGGTVDRVMVVVEEELASLPLRRELRLYTTTGSELGAAELPWSVFASSFRDVRVTAAGDVLQMLALPDGVHLLRWRLSTGGFPLRPMPASYTTACPGDVLPGDDATAVAAFMPEAVRLSRDQMLTRARAYLDHTYTTTGVNHTAGTTCGGKLIVTPRAAAGSWTGLPYKWGGFSGLAGVTSVTDCSVTFDAGIAAGKLDGDKCASSCSGVYFGSCCAVGVDCSGFVSQCWGLASHYGTGQLGDWACALPSWDDLEPGDIVNSTSVGHVRLFERRESNGLFTCIEAAGREWKVGRYSYTATELAAYTPLRKKTLDGWLAVDDRVATETTLNVRACAGTGCTVVGSEAAGNRGTVVGGPEDVDGYTWWQIAYDDGPSGWSVQCYLTGAPPSPGFSWVPGSPVTGQPVGFVDSTLGNPTGWAWQLGDGGTAAGAAPSHTYSTAGVYTVTLTATNGFGSAAVSHPVTVALAAPTVTGVAPLSGPTTGGTAVGVTGTSFMAGAAASVGGVALSGVVVGSATTLNGITGAHAAGVASVLVTNGDGQQGSLAGAYTYLSLLPRRLVVDARPGSTTVSNLNSVLEPGEAVVIEPRWENPAVGSGAATASLDSFTGPVGATYTAVETTFNHGLIAPGASSDCYGAGDCAVLAVSSPATRPATHWDASFRELLSSGEDHAWTLHVGYSFMDVPPSYQLYREVETLLHWAITGGCTATAFCPTTTLSRAQMAMLIARGKAGGDAAVPTSGTVAGQPYSCVPGGASLFSDVPPTAQACRHVHYLAAHGITQGCTATTFCPSGPVSRAQMAMFLARAMAGSDAAVPTAYTDGGSGLGYDCDPAAPSLQFSDVPSTAAYCRHAHYLWARLVTSGCSAAAYCPAATVSRGQAAKLLVNTFGLELYGP